MDCQFNNPVNFLGLPPMEGECWNFQNASCTNDQILLIQNPTTGTEYYLSKTFTYGDLLLVIFGFLIFIFLITKGLWGFFFKK